MHHAPERAVYPAFAVLARSAPVTVSRRGDTLAIQTLRFGVQSSALCDVGNDLAHNLGFAGHDYEVTLRVYIVAVRQRAQVLAVPESAMQTVSGALRDGPALKL